MQQVIRLRILSFFVMVIISALSSVQAVAFSASEQRDSGVGLVVTWHITTLLYEAGTYGKLSLPMSKEDRTLWEQDLDRHHLRSAKFPEFTVKEAVISVPPKNGSPAITFDGRALDRKILFVNGFKIQLGQPFSYAKIKIIMGDILRRSKSGGVGVIGKGLVNKAWADIPGTETFMQIVAFAFGHNLNNSVEGASASTSTAKLIELYQEKITGQCNEILRQINEAQLKKTKIAPNFNLSAPTFTCSDDNKQAQSINTANYSFIDNRFTERGSNVSRPPDLEGFKDGYHVHQRPRGCPAFDIDFAGTVITNIPNQDRGKCFSSGVDVPDYFTRGPYYRFPAVATHCCANHPCRVSLEDALKKAVATCSAQVKSAWTTMPPNLQYTSVQ